jgi:hypothetical protein
LSENALNLTYSNKEFKKFSGVIPADLRLKGGEGKGRYGKDGGERRGKGGEGRGGDKGEGREGRGERVVPGC